jgi:hypothetical protein
MSNRSKTSKYEPNHETQENNVVNAGGRLKTQMNDDEGLKLPPKTGKKTVIVHQNQGMDVHALDAADSYRYSNKYEDILKTD